jgi:ubiquitin carboxyl-terminal hydrolase 2/21
MKKEWSKYADKGLSGLANMGNTCFINSCFQILSHTYEFSEFIDDGTFLKRLSGHKEKKYAVDCFLIIEYYKLHKMIWGKNCIVSPGSFLKTIQNVARQKQLSLFTGFNQNDISEFLLFVLDCFHNALRREVIMNIKGTPENNEDKMAIECYKTIKNMYSKEYSEIIKFFSCVQMSRIMSVDDKTVLSTNSEPLYILNLPIPKMKEPSLYDCIDLYCEEEKLEGDNAWYNEEIKEKQDVIKQTVFWNLPKILIIDLKRFTHTGLKIQVPIDIPLEADFSKYVYGYDKAKNKYELYGICNHMGSTLGGHYTAFVKNANEKWYLYNDTDVKEIDIEKTLNKNYAYCLFYRKKVEV